MTKSTYVVGSDILKNGFNFFPFVVSFGSGVVFPKSFVMIPGSSACIGLAFPGSCTCSLETFPCSFPRSFFPASCAQHSRWWWNSNEMKRKMSKRWWKRIFLDVVRKSVFEVGVEQMDFSQSDEKMRANDWKLKRWLDFYVNFFWRERKWVVGIFKLVNF